MHRTSRPRYELSLRGQALRCRTVRGREAVSEPFRFEVDLGRAADERLAALDPEEIVGDAVRLSLCDDERGEIRAFRAVVTECACDLVESESASISLTIEPRLALLRHRRDVRSFLDKTAIEIVEEVLGGLGIECQRRLTRAYARRDYTVEWRESDLDFVARLLEDEGVSYVVAPDGAVVLGDSPAAWDELPGHLVYGEAHGVETSRDTGEALFDLEQVSRLVPSHVLLRDYDFERPRFELRGEAEVPEALGRPAALPRRTLYDFPGELIGGADPARRARTIAEELAASAGHVRGRSAEPTLAPGGVSTWTQTPEDVPEGRYVILSVTHELDKEAGGFSVAITAIPAEQPYRPPRVTPVPTLTSPLTANVVGPEDIHTDAWARVRLHFPWDRVRPRDARSTAWVPAIQDNTGHSAAIPRRGWEVVVHFLEGDPDRPVVLGRVYNGMDKVPDLLPERKTRSRIQSLTSPSREGMNMIELDDLAGKETFRVYAQRDHTFTIAQDRRSSVLVDESWDVKHDEALGVGRDRRTQVGGNSTIESKGDTTVTIGAERRIEVGKSLTSHVQGSASLTTPCHIRMVGTHESSSGARLVEAVGGIALEAARTGHSTRVGGPLVHAVGGAYLDVAGEEHATRTSGTRTEIVGGLAFATAGRGMALQAGEVRKTEVGASFTVVAGASMDLSAGPSFELKANEGTWKFPEGITLKVGKTEVSLQDGKLMIQGCSEVRVKIDGKAHFAAPNVSQIGGGG